MGSLIGVGEVLGEEPLTIDEMLDNIDLDFPGYEPTKDALEFFAIMRVLKGEDFEIGNGLMHYFIIDMVLGNVTQEMFPYGDENSRIPINNNNIAVVLSRGLAKSTIITLFFPIYVAIKGWTKVVHDVSNILILSDTQEGGSASQYSIMKEMAEQNEARFKIFFESWKFSGYRAEFVRKGSGSKKKRHMQIVFKGVITGGIRSASRNPVTEQRYGIIIGDDVVAREDDAKSPVLMDKINKALFSDAKRAMVGGEFKQMILINTLYTKTDPIYTVTESGVWMPLVVPVCKEIHKGMRESQWKGAWPQMHPFKAVMKDWLEAISQPGLKRIFLQELMCRITNDEDRIVQDEHILWKPRIEWAKNRLNMNYYVTTDFTSSEEANRKNDLSGMALWGVDSDGVHWLVDLNLRHLGIEDQYDELFEMIDRWISGLEVAIGIETDGNQRPHMIAVKLKMQIENKMYFMARQKGEGAKFRKPGDVSSGINSKRAGKDKFDRFKLMSPMFHNKKIVFMEDLKDRYDMHMLLLELKYATWQGLKGPHDDGIDLLSQVNMIDITIPEPAVQVTAKKVTQQLSPGQALILMQKNDRSELGGESEYSS